MKKNSIVCLLAGLALTVSVWGCKGSYPLLADMGKQIEKLADNIIDNFEDEDTFFSINLRGSSIGTWANFGTDGLTTRNTTSYVLDNPFTGGINSSAKVAHVLGTLKDLGNGKYPEVTLQGRFNVANYVDEGGAEPVYYGFDASSFTGIRYMVCVGSADTARKRRFKITIYNTVLNENGGGCKTNCWDHFGNDFSGARDVWRQSAVTFATATREGWGSAITPATFSGINLKQLIGLDWCASGDNAANTYVIDFSVDNVEFF